MHAGYGWIRLSSVKFAMSCATSMTGLRNATRFHQCPLWEQVRVPSRRLRPNCGFPLAVVKTAVAWGVCKLSRKFVWNMVGRGGKAGSRHPDSDGDHGIHCSVVHADEYTSRRGLKDVEDVSVLVESYQWSSKEYQWAFVAQEAAVEYHVHLLLETCFSHGLWSLHRQPQRVPPSAG